MIKSVANVYRWTPDYIGSLYCDDADFLGLEYWYNEAKETHKIEKPNG